MTLNMTVIASWGIWQCSDHRLVDPVTGQLVQDDSAKHVILRFPDGGALLAYSGIGSVAGIQISDWVREILRGESRTLDQSLIFLREKATQSIGPIVTGRFQQMFSIGAFLQGKPWIVQIRNFKATRQDEFGPPGSQFDIVAHRIENQPMVFVSGAQAALSSQQIDDLVRITSRRPNKMEDFHDLLAKYNRLASSHSTYGKMISASCTTSYMPPKGGPVSTKLHPGEDQKIHDIVLPVLLFGIDLTEMSTIISQRLLNNSEEINASGDLDEAGKRSVKPLDRLARLFRRRRYED